MVVSTLETHFKSFLQLNLIYLGSLKGETLSTQETCFPLHFVRAAPKVSCVLRMQSLWPQCTEQWYARVFVRQI